MKYVKYVPLYFLILILILAIIPTIADKHMNPVAIKKEIYVPKATLAMHKEFFIADMHADSLLWKRDLTNKSYRGHLDFVRMREGGIDLQVFSAVTKSPQNSNINKTHANSDRLITLASLQLWPIRTWLSPHERAVYQAQKLQEFAAKDEGFQVVRYREEINKSGRAIYGLLALEGAHAIEENFSQEFQKLYDLGYRMIGLTHFFDNAFAGSAHGVAKGGLTDLGRDLIHLSNERGVIIDLAHASEAAIQDSLIISRKPMVVSHTGLRGHCNNERNISDTLAKKIAAAGGLIAIGFWPKAVCGESINDITSAIQYAVRLVGDNHVALGSDFDGTVQVPFSADNMHYLTQRLLDVGLSALSVEKIMGKNFKDFLQQNLPARVVKTAP